MSVAVKLLVLFAVIVQTYCLSCNQDYECQSVSDNFNFVKCVNHQCACRSDLGFGGSATTADKCRCTQGQVYWGNGNPYCKVCDAPNKIIYDNGMPFCVNPSACETLDATNTRNNIRKDKVRKIYNLLVGSAPYFVLTGQTPVSDIFAPNVKGRVSPVGAFDDYTTVEEYFYGLALTPGQYVTSVNIKSLTASDDKVAVEVDILFNNTVQGFTKNLTQMGFYLFNSDNLVTSLDLVILNLGAAEDIPAVAEPLVIQQLCAAFTSSPGLCPQSADPEGYYKDFNDCVQFMSSIPFGSWNRANSNTVVCRQLHSLLAALRPNVHCPHVGKTGGHKCFDQTYESYYDKEY